MVDAQILEVLLPALGLRRLQRHNAYLSKAQ